MILFVGDKPSKCADPDVPFKGAACEKRLMEWLSYINPGYYEIVNSVSKQDILLINLAIATNSIIIALGNNAAKRLKSYPHFKLPHPSGKNFQINDKEFISKRLTECKNYIESRRNTQV